MWLLIILSLNEMKTGANYIRMGIGFILQAQVGVSMTSTLQVILYLTPPSSVRYLAVGIHRFFL